MFVSLPLLEKGDTILVDITDDNIASQFWYTRPSINLKAVVDNVFADHITTTCKRAIKRKDIYMIYKKYGLRILNPYYKGYKKT